MVFGCTILGAAAQILIKTGLKLLPAGVPLFDVVMAGLFDWHLMLGLTLYGASTVLLVLALRYGELSMLYPVIALTYVWVSVLSLYYFAEVITPYKAGGLVLIIAGVCVLGASQRK